jgi:6-phospho-beta-glucosidase
MRAVKIGVVGGGSVFTPELVDWLLDRSWDVATLVLMDIDAPRLEIVADMARRQAARKGRRLPVETTTDLEAAIDGSDFVLLQLRAGGNTMRIADEGLALRHHIPFVETVSVPGLGAFLRSVPVYDRVAELVRRRAPGAWVINFTNPAGVMTQYLRALGIDAVGVCNSPLFFVQAAAGILQADPDRLFMDWKGLNHLTVVSNMSVGGQPANRLPDVLAKLEPWSHAAPFSAEVLSDLGLGLNTYWQYYFHGGRRLRELESRTESRGQQVLALERQLLDLYARPETDTVPDLLKARGGFGYARVVVNLMQSLLQEDHRVHYVNVPNGATIPGLPEDCVVEVPAVAVNGQVVPLATGPLPEPVFPPILTMATVYRYWVRAALHRSLADLRRSLLVHPLFPDAEEANAILEEFFTLNRAYLEPYR